MPFADAFVPVHEAIVDAMESPEVNFRCSRADEFAGGHEIMVDVLREISSSELVLVDVTGRRSNVFYELGIAHMAKHATQVLLMTQRVDDIPFDLRAYRHIVYSRTAKGLLALKRDLITAVRQVADGIHRFSLPREIMHTCSEQFPGDDDCLYSIHLSDLVVGRTLVKCMVRVDRHVAGEPATTIRRTSFGLRLGEPKELYRRLPWCLRLDELGRNAASFSIIPAPKPRAPARRRGR